MRCKKKKPDKSTNNTMKSTGVSFKLFQPVPHCSEYIQYKTVQRLTGPLLFLHALLGKTCRQAEENLFYLDRRADWEGNEGQRKQLSAAQQHRPGLY